MGLWLGRKKHEDHNDKYIALTLVAAGIIGMYSGLNADPPNLLIGLRVFFAPSFGFLAGMGFSKMMGK